MEEAGVREEGLGITLGYGGVGERRGGMIVVMWAACVEVSVLGSSGGGLNENGGGGDRRGLLGG